MWGIVVEGFGFRVYLGVCHRIARRREHLARRLCRVHRTMGGAATACLQKPNLFLIPQPPQVGKKNGPTPIKGAYFWAARSLAKGYRPTRSGRPMPRV